MRAIASILRLLAAAPVAAMLLSPSAGLAAAQNDQVDRCQKPGKATREEQIAACTAIIEARHLPRDEMAEIFKARGTAYFYGKDYDKALADYGAAIKLAPDNNEAFDNRCWTRGVIGQLQEALKDCREALRLRPGKPATLDTLGFVYLKLGQFDRAIATYDTALSRGQKSSYSLYGRGIAKVKLGRKDEGEADIAAAKELQKDVAEEMARYGIE